MRKLMEKVLSFQDFKQQQQKKNSNEYLCYVTPNRLEGFCELFICEKNLQYADWFFLSFSPNGPMHYLSMEKKKVIQEWLTEASYSQIDYSQAIILLRDAVQQRYKYHCEEKWIEAEKSIHLQRIWMEEYYNDQNCNLNWLLSNQDCSAMLQTYFQALKHKDAALMYDLHAESIKNEASRSLFAYHWSHVLEDLKIFDGEVHKQSVSCNGENDYTILLTVYGNKPGGQQIEVDLRLRIVEEKGQFRILQEQVLEARHRDIKGCC